MTFGLPPAESEQRNAPNPPARHEHTTITPNAPRIPREAHCKCGLIQRDVDEPAPSSFDERLAHLATKGPVANPFARGNRSLVEPMSVQLD
jgi:hypothetical protein